MNDREAQKLRESHAWAMGWASRGRGIADRAEISSAASLFPWFWLFLARRVRRFADDTERKWRDAAGGTYE